MYFNFFRPNSEHPQLISPFVLDIFINSEEKHVGEEDAKAAEEVPDVVEVVEVEEEARLVKMPRLCRGQVRVLLSLQVHDEHHIFWNVIIIP